MNRILVTGSTEGLGRLTAQALLRDQHEVFVHARNHDRADALGPLIAEGAHLVVADLGVRSEVQRMAAELADQELDAVIHNAGVEGGPALLEVNVVAPYLLTALLPDVARHVYLSSDMHHGGRAQLAGLDWADGTTASYSDSKLLLTTLTMAVARLRPDLLANAVNPGWVPTRMGGPNAPDDLELGYQTQVWLATSEDAQARQSGGYWHHQQQERPHASVHDERFQDELLAALAAETGVTFG